MFAIVLEPVLCVFRKRMRFCEMQVELLDFVGDCGFVGAVTSNSFLETKIKNFILKSFHCHVSLFKLNNNLIIINTI